MPKTHSAADIMAKKLHTLSPDDDIASAVALFLEHKISGAPVVDESGALVGVLSEKDCMKILVGSFMENDGRAQGERVRDFMTTTVRTISSSTDIVDVAGIFHQTPFRRLPVVDDGRLVGQVSRRDVLRAISSWLASKSEDVSPTEQGSLITDHASDDVVGPANNRRFVL